MRLENDSNPSSLCALRPRYSDQNRQNYPPIFQNFVAIKKRIKLVKLAPVLTLALQRSKKVGEIQDIVDFPMVLKTNELGLDSSVEDATYDLVGYVRHHGVQNFEISEDNFVGFGHYTAVAKHINSKDWNHFQDAFVTNLTIVSDEKDQNSDEIVIKKDVNGNERVYDESAYMIVYAARSQ
jgi:ubiquitin C-terminal hydrolase